jgi:hypothetical protein
MIEYLPEEISVTLVYLRSEVMMEGTSLLALPEGMQIDQIQITENGLIIAVVATHPASCCPLCSEWSLSIPSHYRRVLRDAPCSGRRVQLVLTMRKFSCRNLLCERKIFTERLPAFVEPWARMTIRYCEQITSIGLATCGTGGTRLAARLGIQTTRQTILRRIMELPDSSAGVILFLGSDDFSFRRGCRFGTLLVKLESRRVVDLLPDREGETSAAWMRQQLDLMVVSRDRGGTYASAAAQGAPQKNSSHKATGGHMQVCVTIVFDDSRLMAERLQQVPHQKDLFFPAHGRLLFCFFALQKSCVSRSKRRLSNSGKLTRKLIWRMISSSGSPTCYVNVRESTLMSGLPKRNAANFPNCNHLPLGWKKTKTL